MADQEDGVGRVASDEADVHYPGAVAGVIVGAAVVLICCCISIAIR